MLKLLLLDSAHKVTIVLKAQNQRLRVMPMTVLLFVQNLLIAKKDLLYQHYVLLDPTQTGLVFFLLETATPVLMGKLAMDQV